MNCTATSLSFEQTGYFSKIIVDYLKQADALQPFYKHPTNLEGIKAAIQARQHFKTNRPVLVAELNKQYADTQTSTTVRGNIDKLLLDNTYTITTAHQPVIFTGTLYFIYKILHAIKLAAYLEEQLPGNHFVPVFYMGSEDADLEELGKIYMDTEKVVWDTTQTGAVGRMNTKGLEQIITRIAGEYSGKPFGLELIALLKDAYLNSPDVQTATFKLVNKLFGEYGLVVLIPDNANLKRQMLPVFEDDLFLQKPSEIVAETTGRLAKQYKVQANPRDINLFFMEDGLRGRIEKKADHYLVHGSALKFDKKEITTALQQHPEKFSPNVILRGLYQETILPNIVFIGGGGETAYWLELKDLFDHYAVPFPVLLLRNSFLLITNKRQQKLDKTGFNVTDIFKREESLINEVVRKDSQVQLSLEAELKDADNYYDKLKSIAGAVDTTLSEHVQAIRAKAFKPLKELEKKLLRAEKRKFGDQRKQVHDIKSTLFPLDGLQERIENFMPYYASSGKNFLDIIYNNSHTFEQDMTVISDLPSDI